jgi:hypothetical protein
MEKLDIQTQHVTQIVCAFVAEPLPVNIIKSFRNSGIELIVDEKCLLCKLILGLGRYILNPTCLQPIPIPGEADNEAVGTNMELCVEEYCGFMFNLEGEEQNH